MDNRVLEIEKQIENLERERVQHFDTVNDPDLDEDGEAGDIYSEFIDETYPDVEIEGICFSASEILKRLDPVGFRQGMVNYFDGDFSRLSQVSDAQYEIGNIDQEIESLQDELEEIESETEEE
jgi:vacuolar-type H+-ATPase subunit I/STV1